ncbi:YaiO family outer membrane beta-barrel protein [Billgrantia kenyensis]|uniref:YaiO family outer membrane beta-barrel protein n=1 Tax=Billgrantia kenyensis TaxID=321266 RepID=A0A7W0ABZ2_9GAMM|nr:YaiO family outer membrane beta-barrel protein [Halomonas kenyensis]MBA2777681.1 YaiO family outer membrane beta-barrel protein [Halomonas kenyensis]MCG6660351.1 YaiO family outer membrane beta-barrel protein [Halomonas kenyensis]
MQWMVDARPAAMAAIVGALVLVPAPFADAQDEERRTEMEASLRYDALDSGFDDWLTQRLDVQSRLRGAPTWYGALHRERRYGTWDEALLAGAAVPLGETWVVQPEVGRTFSADFLAKWHADLGVQRVLGGGYVGSVSLRRTRYEGSQVDRLALGMERYWGNWRGAYTLNVSDVDVAGTPVGHAVALDYYYGERSLVGVRGALGREEEGLPGGEVVTTDVASVSVHGRHWFHDDWALSWELGALSQGDLYDRYGIQLGLRHAF